MSAITAADITKALDQLGTTPEQVAATLKAKGIGGVQGDADECPIALWLAEQFPEAGAFVAAEQYRAVLVSVGGRVVQADAPEAAARFVREFDAGLHPQLVA